jgi:hypothetical protein
MYGIDNSRVWRWLVTLAVIGVGLFAIGSAAVQGTADAAGNAAIPVAYLPLARNAYRRLGNGGFELGLSSWDTQRGPFSGHGTGLPVSAASYQGDSRGLLGTSGNLAAGSIAVGYGSLAQTLTVQQRYVRFDYWVFSYDRAKGEARYYDTLEVSVNRPPTQIPDAERDVRGCGGTLLNPTGTITVGQDGLVLCGGRPGTGGQGTLWDTGGWKSVTLDLGAFQGRNVTLYFTVWSREYEAPFWDDKAWFNTWAYVDNVQAGASP